MKKIQSRAFRIGVKPSFLERLAHHLSGKCLPCNLIGHFMFLDQIEYSLFESDDQKFYKVTSHFINTGHSTDYFFNYYVDAEKCFINFVKKSFISL